MGLPTVGYRSARYNQPEWSEAAYAMQYQSFADRDNAERTRAATEDTMREARALMYRTQDETTRKLAERLKDLHFWKVRGGCVRGKRGISRTSTSGRWTDGARAYGCRGI